MGAMKEKVFGLPKNIFLLGLTSFFNDFSSEMIFSIFPAFFITVLHAGAASLGRIEFFQGILGQSLGQISKEESSRCLRLHAFRSDAPFFHIRFNSHGRA